MSDPKIAIIDAAERRMQLGGFGGFSFREIAADVGVKSSSVHYHFPTKEDLAAAVIRRWAEKTSKHIDAALEKDPNPVRVWTKAFRGTAVSEGRICPCTVLGAGSRDLPPKVASEVRNFFRMCLDKLVAEGLSPGNAAEVLSTITGALVVANAIGDTTAFDRATSDLPHRFLEAPSTEETRTSAGRHTRRAGKFLDPHRRVPRSLRGSGSDR